jgi:rSAM/selenodomain-associated transferase 1
VTRTGSATIIVFAKVPRAGEVKTRLSPPLTPEQAADLYRAMLGDVLATTAAAANALGLEPVLAVHPWDRRGELAHGVPPGFRLVPQHGRDLGARMDRAVREAAAAGHRRILLRGSDSPTLDRAQVAGCLAALADHDLVLQPDPDGGYGLVGLRRHHPDLFDHPMSDAGVLAATRANARRHGLRVSLTEPGFDIDVADDLRRLGAQDRGALRDTCPRTLAFLDDHALWPVHL